jgi:hypothetical protein
MFANQALASFLLAGPGCLMQKEEASATPVPGRLYTIQLLIVCVMPDPTFASSTLQ